MESFSQKYGYKSVRTVIQVNGIDSDLRNSLWNALDVHYWWNAERKSRTLEGIPDLYLLCMKLGENYFKMTLDTMPTSPLEFKEVIKKYFFECEWFEVYDFIQFVANNYSIKNTNVKFIKYCNDRLKLEMSGYRFVGTTITRITSEEEIAEIEEALASKDAFHPVATHLQTALEYLSDRKTPDYRNSIKESISAVEAICRLIAGNDAALGIALGEIQRQGKITLHKALRNAFDQLYGYTSDEKGIRHSLMEQSKLDLDFEDAKFMLVSCSAFVNYLKIKASKSGIDLESQ